MLLTQSPFPSICIKLHRSPSPTPWASVCPGSLCVLAAGGFGVAPAAFLKSRRSPRKDRAAHAASLWTPPGLLGWQRLTPEITSAAAPPAVLCRELEATG